MEKYGYYNANGVIELTLEDVIRLYKDYGLGVIVTAGRVVGLVYDGSPKEAKEIASA